MLLRLVVPLLTAFAALASPASGQNDVQASTEDNRCWFASKSFAPGAAVAFGDRFVKCSSEGVWINETERQAANCLYNDSYYGLGSLVEVNDITLECGAEGDWSRHAE